MQDALPPRRFSEACVSLTCLQAAVFLFRFVLMIIQSDQIGGIFAQWVIVCVFWVYFQIAEVAHILGCFFPQLRLCIKFDQNEFGYVLGDIFHKLIWPPCDHFTTTLLFI
jgi:glycerol uptake facilitator-like aquaporin